MPKRDGDVSQKILEKLTLLEPPIKRFPVTPADPAMGIFLVKLADVCYISTKSDQGREETLFKTATESFYSNYGLGEIEKQLAEHPHFMRTSKYYIVNLTKICGLKVSAARDLWFDGIKEPIQNGVTNTYLAEFEKRLK